MVAGQINLRRSGMQNQSGEVGFGSVEQIAHDGFHFAFVTNI